MVIHATEPAPVVVTFDLHPKVLFLLFPEWTSRLILKLNTLLVSKNDFSLKSSWFNGNRLKIVDFINIFLF